MGALWQTIAALAKAGALPAALVYPFMARGLIAGFVLAPLLGGLSHLVVARRFAFLSAALGQAALTGLAIGLVLGEPLNAPYGGITGFCLLAALGMVYVRRRSALPADTLIGVFLALTLGLGICLLVAVTKRFNIHQIEAVMFGSLLTVTDGDLGLLAIVAILVLALLAVHYNQIVFDSLSAPLARVAGLRSAYLEYLLVVLLTISIVVGLKIIGALLVEALVIVPSAAARNLARSLRAQVALSVLIAWIAVEGGLLLSSAFEVPSGGAVVLALSAMFFVTFGLGHLRGLFGGGLSRGGRPLGLVLGVLAAALFAEPAAEAHIGKQAKAILLYPRAGELGIIVTWDVNRGDDARVCRSLADRDHDGQLNEAERERLRQSFVNRAMAGLVLTLDGAEVHPKLVESKAWGFEHAVGAPDPLGVVLTYALPLQGTQRDVLLEDRSVPPGAQLEVPVIVTVPPDLVIGFADQGEWHPLGQTIRNVSLNKDRPLRLRTRLRDR